MPIVRTTTVVQVAAAVVLATFTAACSQPRLAPAPQANATPGAGAGATATQAGVTVEARARAWSATPASLATQVTPILVTITNGSAVPLRIRYNELHLTAADGHQFEPIPPFDVTGSVTRPVTNYAYPVTGFTVSPYLSPYYPGFGPVIGPPLAYDPLYYNTYYNTFRQIQLPTADMIDRALPEGAVAPGGSIGGFIYFQHVGDSADQVTFRFDLVNATTQAPFGSVRIPFNVKQ